MDFDAVVTNRFSVRAFLDTPVDPEFVAEIVTLAQHSPSWCNSQAWQLDVTSPESTRELSRRLLDHAGSGAAHESDIEWPTNYEGVYAARRRASGYALYDSLGIDHSDRERRFMQALENLKFFGAPHTAVISTPKDLGSYGVLDCGGFVSTFQFVAHSRGIASIAQAAPTMYSSVVREFVGIDDDRDIVCVISFGYADDTHPVNQFRTVREGAENVVHWR